MQFVEGQFIESYYPTIEDTFNKIIRYNGQDFSTEIIDTAGQDEYSILNSKHFIGIHGYMLVYSVASLQSFEMVQIVHEKILHHLVCYRYLRVIDIHMLLRSRIHRALRQFPWSWLATRVTSGQINVKSR
jgi:small GTP-binding protein